jgi:hypothetical protein
MGGYQVPGSGSGDDGYDEDGYDESQRAEILEATSDGPTDGNIMTDLVPDLGNDDSDEDEDDLRMVNGEIGEEDDDAVPTGRVVAEDEVQAGFDEDPDNEDDELDDADEDALEP